MSYTPGPWHQRTNLFWNDPGYVKTEDGTTVAHAKLGEADARLIATAPELLQVTTAFLDWYGGRATNASIPAAGPTVLEAAIGLARDAIAKATGEQP